MLIYVSICIHFKHIYKKVRVYELKYIRRTREQCLHRVCGHITLSLSGVTHETGEAEVIPAVDGYGHDGEECSQPQKSAPNQ